MGELEEFFSLETKNKKIKNFCFLIEVNGLGNDCVRTFWVSDGVPVEVINVFNVDIGQVFMS